MSVINVNSKNFENEVLNSEKMVIVDFYTNWCGPCKMMSPIIEKIAMKNPDKIKVCKINVDESQELAQKYKILSIPTLIFFKQGEIINTIVGLTDEEDILSKIK